MGGISLYRLDQVRNEIAAATQLHVDAAPGLTHHVACADQAVEDHDRAEYKRDDSSDDDPCHRDRHYGASSFAAKTRLCRPRRTKGSGAATALASRKRLRYV